MNRFEEAAREAVSRRLETDQRDLPMWEIICLADNAAREVGRKSSLYLEAAQYRRLLPTGWRIRWVVRPGGSTRVMYACPPDRQSAGLMNQRNHENRQSV